ncbi:serine/threonine-protein phosphatase [Yinghuangia sp. ASG 101]|nr:serine/threonine-protein phosphatase [Yinghuangia sp. ASG 101]
MSRISNIMRVVAHDEQTPPSRILRRLDKVLHDLHGGPMATVIVARLEPAASGRVLHWSSAGHPPPLVVAPGTRAHHLDGEPGPPLGVDPDAARRDHRLRLPAGGTVVLHTDGLVEARDHSIDEGMRNAAAIVERHATAPLADLCDALIRSPGRPLRDDVALLAARVTT